MSGGGRLSDAGMTHPVDPISDRLQPSFASPEVSGRVADEISQRMQGLALIPGNPQHMPYHHLPHNDDQYQTFSSVQNNYSPYQQQNPMFQPYMAPANYGYTPQTFYEPSEFSVETMHGMPGYQGRPPIPRSNHTSPLNPSPPYPHYPPSQPYSRPSTAQTQAYGGMWSSPPISPVLPPQYGMGGGSRHPSQVEFSGRGMYYGGSAWSSPTAPAHPFYPQLPPPTDGRSSETWSMGPSPIVPQGPFPSRVYGQPDQTNRMSWGGPSRPIRTEDPEKERERKAYHPQPPARRSDWVMWVGNVPNNTSHEELWRYFNSTIPSSDPEADEAWRGPSSIFLISRSSCAFVNLSSQADLDRAVGFFNGRPLRPWDPRCPRMVCRIRRKDDDLRAGVGAQRGTGMHRDWVKQNPIELSGGQQSSVPNDRNDSVPPSPAIMEHPPEGEGRRRDSVVNAKDTQHKTSASFASTNSSFLTKHYPKRFFILKSLTTAELEDSAKSGTWRTQRHNEPILAFRTSSEGVFLIFGANRSGEFFGYAKMVEPIDKNRAAKKSDSLVSHPSQRSSSGSGSAKYKSQPQPEQIKEEDEDDRVRAGSEPIRPTYFLSPSQSHVASSSPGELTPAEEPKASQRGERKTDPLRPITGVESRLPSAAALRAHTMEPRGQPSYFPPVPIGASLSSKVQVDNQQVLGGSTRVQQLGDDGVLRKDTALSPTEKKERTQEHRDEIEDPQEFGPDGWGQPFNIQWIKVASLPFGRTRHLRNPWNADREVKVSRDGTEVEPNVGAQLLTEWDARDRFDITDTALPNTVIHQHRYAAVY